MERRTDIDGLRAVAVLGVISYHFDFGVSGGFGGVDIFFVISGFLIAGILIDEIYRGSFSFVGFYERRIRRIFPALCACLLATSLVATWMLFPNDYRPFAKSLLSTVTSTSNFFFASQQGYFDSSAISKPLLHTWSLSIEEQFYLVFPLVLYLLLKRGRAAALVGFLSIAAASLAYSANLVGIDPARAFFSTPGRVWELLTGVLLALGMRAPAPVRPSVLNSIPEVGRQEATRWRVVRELEGLCGIASISYGLLALSDETPFPGLAALPFCLGAALVIHSGAEKHGPATAVARLLSLPPLVAVGLISYSLYLWHWPLLVFTHYRFPEFFEDGFTYKPLVGALLLVASLVISAMSWRYVEQPFRRRGTKKILSHTVFAWSGAAAAFFVSIAIVGNGAGNVLQRWPADFLSMMKFRKPVPSNKCAPLAEGDALRGSACRIGTGEARTILWGDSHASALFPAFARYSDETGQGVIIAARPGCPPLDGVTLYGHGVDATCGKHNATVISRALQSDIKRVVIAARWGLYADGTSPEGGEGFTRISPQPDQTAEAFTRLIVQTIERLASAGRQVVIVGPVPEYAFDVRAAVARHLVWQKPLPAAISVDRFLRRERVVLPLLHRLERLPNVRVLYPHDRLCAVGTCEYMRSGEPLYDDSNHLSITGAMSLLDLVRQIFNPTAKVHDVSSREAGPL